MSAFYVQLYRLERYSECRSVYTDLIRNSQDEYEEERKTNLAAVVASVSQWESDPVVSRTAAAFASVSSVVGVSVRCLRSFFFQEILDLPESTYELCYNAACALIGQGKLTEANRKLQQAEGRFCLLLLLLFFFAGLNYVAVVITSVCLSFDRALQSLFGRRFGEC